MSQLFEPIEIGKLSLRNRLIRSATAERLSDLITGAPTPALGAMYRRLAEGGIGLLVTGHACVEMQGRAHPKMSAIDHDDLVPAWREIIRPAQAAGARLMMQINHAGASVDPTVTFNPISPSGVATNERILPGIMYEDDIQRIVAAFGQGARRAREAGFDGVQIHGAHGYLVTQFLSTYTNRRTDAWGGDLGVRMRFLEQVVAAMRAQVGHDYPIWIKSGVAGRADGGLTLDQGAAVARRCVELGVDAIEISHAIGQPVGVDERAEAAYLPLAPAVRQAVGPDYPLALVYGFRQRQTMEEVLQGGVVQLISLCRPLILEPELPLRMQQGLQESARCVRCGRCWPEVVGDHVRCHNRALAERTEPGS